VNSYSAADTCDRDLRPYFSEAAATQGTLTVLEESDLHGGMSWFSFYLFFFAYPYFLQQTEETINLFPLILKK